MREAWAALSPANATAWRMMTTMQTMVQTNLFISCFLSSITIGLTKCMPGWFISKVDMFPTSLLDVGKSYRNNFSFPGKI
jgi:hypothetical protein